MKIVILDGYTTNPGDLDWSWLEQYGEAAIYDRTPAELLLSRAKDAEILITNKTPLRKETLRQLPQLEYVSLLSTGFNIIDGAAAREQGIVVTNIPSYSTSAVAQMVFAFLLEWTNHIAAHNEMVHQGEWSRCKDFCFWNTPLTELQGKVLGVIGFGKIGQKVAEIAQAMDMQVLAYSPSRGERKAGETLAFVSLETLLKNADFVTLHCPLNEQTRGMIGKDALSLMKPNAFLINTSRGPVVQEQALYEALKEKAIAGAGLDVMEREPPAPANPLLALENCLITPHIAWAGHETRARLMEILKENFQAYFAGSPIHVVN